jgi:hypothetical protein
VVDEGVEGPDPQVLGIDGPELEQAAVQALEDGHGAS